MPGHAAPRRLVRTFRRLVHAATLPTRVAPTRVTPTRVAPTRVAPTRVAPWTVARSGRGHRVGTAGHVRRRVACSRARTQRPVRRGGESGGRSLLIRRYQGRHRHPAA